jgi:hypothetical protein
MLKELEACGIVESRRRRPGTNGTTEYLLRYEALSAGLIPLGGTTPAGEGGTAERGEVVPLARSTNLPGTNQVSSDDVARENENVIRDVINELVARGASRRIATDCANQAPGVAIAWTSGDPSHLLGWARKPGAALNAALLARELPEGRVTPSLPADGKYGSDPYVTKSGLYVRRTDDQTFDVDVVLRAEQSSSQDEIDNYVKMQLVDRFCNGKPVSA